MPEGHDVDVVASESTDSSSPSTDSAGTIGIVTGTSFGSPAAALGRLRPEPFPSASVRCSWPHWKLTLRPVGGDPHRLTDTRCGSTSSALAPFTAGGGGLPVDDRYCAALSENISPRDMTAELLSLSLSTVTVQYVKHTTRTKLGERAFSCAGPAAWNALPANLHIYMTLQTPVNSKNHLRPFCSNKHSLLPNCFTVSLLLEYCFYCTVFIVLFLQRISIACYAERCISYSKSVRLSVRLTVCPSHAGTESKRLKLQSWSLHWRIAP